MISIRARHIFVALLAPLMLGGLAACGSGADDGDNSGKPKASSEEKFYDWQLSYAKCMRAEGIDMPDPNPDPSGGTAALQLDEGQATAFEAGNKVCVKKLGDPPSPDGKKYNEAEQLEEMLKTAKCLRDRGYDVADPEKGTAMGLPMDVDPKDADACFGGGVSKRTTVMKD